MLNKELLIRILNNYNNSYSKDESLTSTGFSPIDIGLFADRFDRLVNSMGNIYNQPRLRLLEFGAGIGTNLVYTANSLVDAYGIEIHPVVTKKGNTIIKDLKDERFLPHGVKCELIQGSYFPNRYIKHRKNGSIAVKEERKIKERKDNQVLFAQPNPRDIYKEHKIPFESFDIFFAYAWEKQAPSIIEMFSLYAKPDAVMLMISAYYPGRIARPLKLKIICDDDITHIITKAA